jgi:glycosyltransferase involved in cell wall biosynthesis
MEMYCIPNGINANDFSKSFRKKSYALVLTRICEEKGVHVALRAAHLASTPLIIAGQVYGYLEHSQFYRQEVEPLLDNLRKFIGPATLPVKRRLLAEARCVLVPSVVEETSSLVAMEALASGTPVIAFRRGALPELIRHGETGFVVQDEREMAEAIPCCSRISPEYCRDYAAQHFSAERCVRRYFALYESLARRARMQPLLPGTRAL